MRRVRPARSLATVILVFALTGMAITAGGETVRGADAGFDIVGRTSLGDRGMNAALAVAGSCAFAGSRADGTVKVVDVSTPTSPRVAGELPRHPGSTPREVRAVPAARELVVLSYALNGGPNLVEVYRWSNDCLSPSLAGSHNFGSRAPHEFYLWQDPGNSSRVLLYVSMFGAAGDGVDVLDISNPAALALLGGWAVPSAYGHAPLHSIDISADGRTAYISLWTGGLAVGDVSDFATAKPNPTLRPLTPPGGAFRTAPGDVHSAVPMPGTSIVVTTDERYPSQGCPFGSAHVVDVSTPAAPRAISTLSVPENAPAACSSAAKGTWTSHNVTLTAHLALVSWYSAGMQVFGLDDPAAPQRLGEIRPGGATPALRDLELGVTDTMMWSYPVISGGLVYVIDINQGLLVLRYHGPHQDEVSGAAFLEGNSNVAAAGGSSPTASDSSVPSQSVTATSPGPTSRSFPTTLVAVVVGAGVLALVVLVGAVLLARRARARP